jgi:hypothetical protein
MAFENFVGEVPGRHGEQGDNGIAPRIAFADSVWRRFVFF